jgi:hypothetical protein
MGIGSYGCHNPIPGIGLDFDPILANTNPGIGTVAVLVTAIRECRLSGRPITVIKRVSTLLMAYKGHQERVYSLGG